MTQKELTLLYSYILNNRVRLENDVTNAQNNIRFRKIDIVDCIELIHVQVQLETFKRVTKDIRILLDIDYSDDI